MLTVLVLGETPVEDIDLAVEELMGPYEMTDASGYQDLQPPAGVCRCGYIRAQRTAWDLADESYPTPEPDDDTPKSLVLLRMLNSAQLYARAFRLMRRHELHSPSCLVCGGTGRYPEGLVAEGKFDGAMYGGWFVDGWICGAARERDSSATPRLEDNLTTVAELLERAAAGDAIVTYALLTPDGFWHECSWLWGHEERRAFDREFVAVLESNRECWAVGVECHR